MFAFFSMLSNLSYNRSIWENKSSSWFELRTWLLAVTSSFSLFVRNFKNLTSCIGSFSIRLVHLAGLEPATHELEVQCSVHLSYRCEKKFPPQGYFTPTDRCNVRTNPYAMWWDLSAQNPEMWVIKRLLDCPINKIYWLRWSSASISFLPLLETGASTIFHVCR